MEKVLFICVHNSARSQMAEAYLNMFGQDDFLAESAGFEPTSVNPLVVEVMKEEGVDLSAKETRSAFDLFREGRMYSHVITVCNDDHEARCPVYPGVVNRIHIPFADPAGMRGTREEQLSRIRELRDEIKAAVKEFVAWVREGAEGDFAKRIGR
ncbi:arsenate reductase ArsC [Pseudodesulfovibrio sp. F-1]|uniref:Arsenate reductase ArsC n=1 Tax=Pseudodesulfovibrio alkaliphilus TaxID=2661613 RepID=A0A7K1KPS6_9BACT|nr:arsenate reductase ArsC [Pseudodesulfovibrio alkaliphilus]MUM78088.1 arsenate reductase ArsC [Pseudodesulfovibrio alkaliphilus]